MTEKTAIENCWEIFAKEAVGEHAPVAQRQAMYMAFLAGADTILQLELTVREREASHRRKLAFEQWATFTQNELRRISGEQH